MKEVTRALEKNSYNIISSIIILLSFNKLVYVMHIDESAIIILIKVIKVIIYTNIGYAIVF